MSSFSAERKAILAKLAALGFLALACEAVTPTFTWDDSLLRNGICQEGFFRCFGAGLYTCNHDLKGWTLVKQCDSEQRCDSADARCTTCGSERWMLGRPSKISTFGSITSPIECFFV